MGMGSTVVVRSILVEPITPMRGRFGMVFLLEALDAIVANDDRQSSPPRQAVSSADWRHRLTPPSTAWRSISLSSPAVQEGLSIALTLSVTWSGLLAPISADVTRVSLNVQASAIWASVWPRRLAMALSSR